MSKQYSDIEFLDGLRHNNEAVLRALYKKYYASVLKYVVTNSGTSEAAQDVYQETIIVLYENAQKETFQLSCQLHTYIYSIAKRLWLKQLRAHGQTVQLLDKEEKDIVDVSEDISEHLEKENNINRMADSLQKLGEPCQSLIQDFYIHHLSMETIAEKFGYTNADNAKNQKYKCLQRLKRGFFNEDKD